MKHRILLVAGLVALAACAETPTEPALSIDEPLLFSQTAATTLTLASGSGGDILTTCFHQPVAPGPNPCAGADIGSVAPTTGQLGNAWVAPLPGTSWIAPVSNGGAGNPNFVCCTVAVFENQFSLPADAQNAQISIQVSADNLAAININGSPVGVHDNAGSVAAFAYHGTYTAPISPDGSGTNVLEVILQDGGGAMGVNYLATVTYEESGPQTKADCKKGGWQNYGFRNQGQCVRYVQTGKDSR